MVFSGENPLKLGTSMVICWGKKYKYTSLSGTKRKLLAQENQKKRDSWFNSNFRTTELRHHNVMGRSSPPGPCKTGGRATFVRPSEVFFDF